MSISAGISCNYVVMTTDGSERQHADLIATASHTLLSIHKTMTFHGGATAGVTPCYV